MLNFFFTRGDSPSVFVKSFHLKAIFSVILSSRVPGSNLASNFPPVVGWKEVRVNGAWFRNSYLFTVRSSRAFFAISAFCCCSISGVSGATGAVRPEPVGSVIPGGGGGGGFGGKNVPEPDGFGFGRNDPDPDMVKFPRVDEIGRADAAL